MRSALAMASLGFLLTGCASDRTVDWIGGGHRDRVWRNHPPMQSGLGASATVARKETIYVIGGGAHCNAANNVVQWSKVTKNGSSGIGLVALPDARFAGAAANIDGTIYFFGGCNGNVASENMWQYNFVANSWTPAPSLNQPRFAFASAVIDGKIYVGGGATVQLDGTIDLLPGNFEVFDPQIGEWQVLPRVPTARMFAGGAAGDGRFYVIGGHNADQTEFYVNVEAYDPETGLWSSEENLANATAGAATTLEGRIYVVGGATQALPATNVVHVYDPFDEAWGPGPEMPTARKWVQPVVTRNNLYVAGGLDGGGASIPVVDGLVPEDDAGSEPQPQNWQSSSNPGGGPGPTNGPDDNGDCSVHDTRARGPSAGFALLALAAIGIVSVSRRRRA